MTYLAIAQFMAAAAFLTIAAIHLLIWLRARQETNHLLFAMTSAAAGANAIVEALMYRANSIELMATALRWYVGTSGIWAIATVLFICSYACVGRVGRYLASTIVIVLGGALLINFFSPASYLYTELTGLRQITFPWGEEIWLATGNDNPFRIVTELALVGIAGVVADGCYQFWQRGHRSRAVVFGTSLFAFLACFGTHAFLVDTGQIDSPYLSTYGFLALVGLTSYDLAGEVMRQSQLAHELSRKDSELRTVVEDERSRIANDLHDSVTQTLFSTAAIADALPDVWQKSPAEAAGSGNIEKPDQGSFGRNAHVISRTSPLGTGE